MFANFARLRVAWGKIHERSLHHFVSKNHEKTNPWHGRAALWRFPTSDGSPFVQREEE
jgi:hypothetical protein